MPAIGQPITGICLIAMKLRIHILLALALCLSCTEEIVRKDVPESITVNNENTIYITNGAVAYAEAIMTPAEYDLTSSKTAVTIEVVESNISTFKGTAPIYYSLAEITKVTGQTGR